jgi:ferrous iron transport protein A
VVPAEGGPVRLAELAPGCQATVVGLAADTAPATARRLVDLGFTAGATVQVVRRAPPS